MSGQLKPGGDAPAKRFDFLIVIALATTTSDQPEVTQIAAVVVDAARGVLPDSLNVKVRPTETVGTYEGNFATQFSAKFSSASDAQSGPIDFSQLHLHSVTSSKCS